MSTDGAVHVSVHLDGQHDWPVRLLGEDRACFAAIDLADTVTFLSSDPEQLGRFADVLARAAVELLVRRGGPQPVSGVVVGAVV